MTRTRTAEYRRLDLPFRWALGGRDQLGALLRGVPPPNLWYWQALVRCAAQVLGRSGGGTVYFIGRSLDSVYDFLSGALAETSMRDRLVRVPVSCKSERGLSGQEHLLLRAILATCGLTPHVLQRGRRPAVFCDTVDTALTFTNLFTVLRSWIADEAQWEVARTKVRFLGVVKRNLPSPDIWRWYQHAAWTRELPRRASSSIAMDVPVWEHLTNHQPKITPSFGPHLWGSDDVRHPPRSDQARAALAEADALFTYGANPRVRHALGCLLARERAMRERWLRALIKELHGRSGHR